MSKYLSNSVFDRKVPIKTENERHLVCQFWWTTFKESFLCRRLTKISEIFQVEDLKRSRIPLRAKELILRLRVSFIIIHQKKFCRKTFLSWIIRFHPIQTRE